MFRDTLRGYDRASLEMHLEAIIMRVWSYALEAMVVRTLRQKSSEREDSHRGRDGERSDEKLEAVDGWHTRC